jgi:exosome complex RNA-binding protein Rrp4
MSNKSSKQATDQTKERGHFVLPGDSISIDETGTIKLGPGLHRVGQETIVTKPGLLHQVNGTPHRFWVNGSQKRVRFNFINNPGINEFL